MLVIIIIINHQQQKKNKQLLRFIFYCIKYFVFLVKKIQCRFDCQQVNIKNLSRPHTNEVEEKIIFFLIFFGLGKVFY